MQNRPEHSLPGNPLRHLTPAQFMALGGTAVIYVRSITGSQLSSFMTEDFEDEALFQLVVSADGQPLLVADSEEAVAEWLADKNLGIVTLH